MMAKNRGGFKAARTSAELFIDDLYHEQKASKIKCCPPKYWLSQPIFDLVCGHQSFRRVGFHLPDRLEICATAMARLRVGNNVSRRAFRTCWKTATSPSAYCRSFRLGQGLASGRLCRAAVRHAGGHVARPGDDPLVVVLTPGIYNSACLNTPTWRSKWGSAGAGQRYAGR